MGKLPVITIFLTFDGFCHQTFHAARSDVLRTTESDSDDEEEYEIKRNKFGALIYGLKPAPYLNCNDPVDRSLALQTVTNPFRKISVWKKDVSFLGSLPVPLKQVNWKPDYKSCYTKEEEATRQWRTEIRYQGVFEYMAGVYSVPLQGAYNPPSYAQPQYDQLYQQFPPPPPQYQQQQQQDDDE
ncbi:hypothetical protein Tco_0542593 [Tanacetum coccineum]